VPAYFPVWEAGGPRPPATDLARAFDGEIYPDLLEAGGLAAAIAGLCAAHGIDLGEMTTHPLDGRFNSARFRSDRGSIGVVLAAGNRSFSVSMSSTGHLQASGGTDNLLEVVRAIDAWRKGATLAELVRRFPFMKYSGLAKAFEDGDPVTYRWNQVLDDPDLDKVHMLLVAVRSHDALGKLFPSVSHYVRLLLDRDPEDRAKGTISIRIDQEAGYRVDASWVDSAQQASTVDDAVATAAALLDEAP
jgi:hypothetical protein